MPRQGKVSAMTSLGDFITPSYTTFKGNNDFKHINFNFDEAKAKISDELMQRLKATLDTNQRAHDIYYGLIDKPSRSEYDFGLARELKWEGYTLQETGNILCHFSHGKEADQTRREIIRIYNKCAFTAEEEFDSVSEADLETIKGQPNPILEARDRDITLQRDLRSIPADIFEYQHLSEMDWRYSGSPIYKDLLYDKAITVIYGQSNVGKSFIAADIAGHVALGLDWNKIKYKPKRKIGIIYICAEAGPGFGKRGEALRNKLNVKQAKIQGFPFFTIDAAPNFSSKKGDAKRIVQTIKTIEKEYDFEIGLVVVDTLATTFEGGNENSSEDMGMYISNMKYIQRHADTGVLIVHHSGKDQAAGARGHSSLRAATDTEMEVTSEKAGQRYNRKVKVKKQREGQNDQTISFGLNVIELGKDEDGDSITTCNVVLENDSEFDAVFAKPEDILSGRKKAAFLTFKKFQQSDFLQWCQNKTITEIRKLMVKNWFLIKESPEKVLSLLELEKADVNFDYANESSNFSSEFNSIKEYLDKTELKLSQWIKENLVKPPKPCQRPNDKKS